MGLYLGTNSMSGTGNAGLGGGASNEEEPLGGSPFNEERLAFHVATSRLLEELNLGSDDESGIEFKTIADASLQILQELATIEDHLAGGTYLDYFLENHGGTHDLYLGLPTGLTLALAEEMSRLKGATTYNIQESLAAAKQAWFDNDENMTEFVNWKEEFLLGDEFVRTIGLVFPGLNRVEFEKLLNELVGDEKVLFSPPASSSSAPSPLTPPFSTPQEIPEKKGGNLKRNMILIGVALAVIVSAYLLTRDKSPAVVPLPLVPASEPSPSSTPMAGGNGGVDASPVLPPTFDAPPTVISATETPLPTPTETPSIYDDLSTVGMEPFSNIEDAADDFIETFGIPSAFDPNDYDTGSVFSYPSDVGLDSMSIRVPLGFEKEDFVRLLGKAAVSYGIREGVPGAINIIYPIGAEHPIPYEDLSHIIGSGIFKNHLVIATVVDVRKVEVEGEQVSSHGVALVGSAATDEQVAVFNRIVELSRVIGNRADAYNPAQFANPVGTAVSTANNGELITAENVKSLFGEDSDLIMLELIPLSSLDEYHRYITGEGGNYEEQRLGMVVGDRFFGAEGIVVVGP